MFAEPVKDDSDVEMKADDETEKEGGEGDSGKDEKDKDSDSTDTVKAKSGEESDSEDQPPSFWSQLWKPSHSESKASPPDPLDTICDTARKALKMAVRILFNCACFMLRCRRVLRGFKRSTRN